MQSLKSVIKILLLSLVVVLPSWQTVYAAETSSPAVEQSLTVNINTATAPELAEMLSGIGNKRAEAIVAYRDAHGSFSSVEQLLEVKGVGEKVLEKNRAKLVLECF